MTKTKRKRTLCSFCSPFLSHFPPSTKHPPIPFSPHFYLPLFHPPIFTLSKHTLKCLTLFPIAIQLCFNQEKKKQEALTQFSQPALEKKLCKASTSSNSI